MIQSKKDLLFYLKEDRKRNLKVERMNPFKYMVYCVYSNNNIRAYRYLKSLRRYEYALNCLKNKGFLGKIICAYFKIVNHYMGLRYNISALPNTIGYGFYLPHVLEGSGGIILNCKSIGNYCAANTGVVVGNNHKSDWVPIIGDFVQMNAGCKIVGKVTVGNNVIIGPNSVVYKDVSSDCIVLGVPAQVIRHKDKQK